MLLLGTMGFGTTYAQSPTFSSFEYNQASNSVVLEWLNSTNAFYEMQSSTNLMTGLWGQDGGWTNILGTNPTNQVSISVDGRPNGFFRLLARTNSPQTSLGQGIAMRANSSLVWGTGGGNPPSAPLSWSSVYVWDAINYTYNSSTFVAAGGWSTSLTISNNQSFIYWPSSGEGPPPDWPYAYAKDYRLISPGDLPVTGNVLIEWAAFESYSTPSNPVPDIPVVDVTIRNSDYMIITNWTIYAPVSSSTIWNSHGNPAGYYFIEVNLANDIIGIIEKQIYLYN